jgi:hypothetical protein
MRFDRAAIAVIDRAAKANATAGHFLRLGLCFLPQVTAGLDNLLANRFRSAGRIRSNSMQIVHLPQAIADGDLEFRSADFDA